MGAGPSIPEDVKNGMATKQAELLANFAVQFASGFKSALVEQCKSDAEGAGEDLGNTRKLPDAEKPSFALYEGWVDKSAPTSMLSYKRRYMTVGNEGDNWELNYKEKEDSPKVKGTVNCKAYNCERFNSADREDAPSKFGVKLVPVHKWDDTARTWYFRVDNEKDEDGFYEAIKEACWKAGPPIPKDQPVIGAAFKICMKNLAKSENCHMSFDDYGIVESLSKFVYFVICRDFLDAEIDKIEMPMGKDAAVKVLKSATYTLINAGVKATWTVAEAAASAGVNKIQSLVAAQMAPLVKAEADLLDKVADMTEKTIGAAMKELTSKLFSKTLRNLGLPIGNAFSETIKGFDAYMKADILAKVKECGTDANKLNALQVQVDRKSSYYWSGPMEKACRSAYEIPKLIQDDACFSEGTGVTVHEVSWMVRGACKTLYRNAANKFFQMAKGGSTDHAASLAIVTGEMIHDAPEIVQDLYFEIFGECLATNPLYTSLIADPITGAVQPMADTIAQIPLVGELIDLMGTVDKCLETFLQSTMSPSIAECLDSKYLNQDDLILATKATPCH